MRKRKKNCQWSVVSSQLTFGLWSLHFDIACGQERAKIKDQRSKTGFGRGTVGGEDFTVAVEIKTVNNRYLDIHLRIGQELSAVENSIRRRVGARLSRGRVDLNINFERTGATVYEVNRPLIAGYISAIREIQEQFKLGGEIDINAVARVPGALTPARDGINDASIAGLESALDQALDDLEQMRETEGAALAEEMRVR